MTKNTTLPKCSKAKITTWSIIQCPKFQQDHTIKWQCLTIKLSMKHEATFCQTKKPKEKLTLMSMWEFGAWVLGSWRSPSSSLHSNDGWYFLPWEVRKEGLLEEDDILMQEKMGLKMGFYQKCVCSRSAQKHKDLKKKIKGDEWRKVEKFRKVFFIFFGEEMVRWRRKVKWRRSWIVLMVEERWRKEKAKKRKKETRKVGGQY